MSFSKEWDEQYRANAHMSRWPWSDLISAVYRNASPENGYKRVLELGCGAGANIPFFQALGVDYHAIDGSETVVDILHQRFPDLAEKIAIGDFTKSLPFSGKFDLVVDRSSLISNTTDAIKDGLKLAASQMRSGARFVAVDWFSDAHEGAHLGIAVDSHTRTDFPHQSDLAGIGRIHFCDKAHLIALLESAGLDLVELEHKTNVLHLPHDGGVRAWWNFVAVKP